MTTISVNHSAAQTTSAVAQHEAARRAWERASTAAEVRVARDLSQAAMVASCPSAAWLEDLDAACIDAEAEHAADLHARAITLLRTQP